MSAHTDKEARAVAGHKRKFSSPGEARIVCLSRAGCRVECSTAWSEWDLSGWRIRMIGGGVKNEVRP